MRRSIAIRCSASIPMEQCYDAIPSWRSSATRSAALTAPSSPAYAPPTSACLRLPAISTRHASSARPAAGAGCLLRRCGGCSRRVPRPAAVLRRWTRRLRRRLRHRPRPARPRPWRRQPQRRCLHRLQPRLLPSRHRRLPMSRWRCLRPPLSLRRGPTLPHRVGRGCLKIGRPSGMTTRSSVLLMPARKRRTRSRSFLRRSMKRHRLQAGRGYLRSSIPSPMRTLPTTRMSRPSGMLPAGSTRIRWRRSNRTPTRQHRPRARFVKRGARTIETSLRRRSPRRRRCRRRQGQRRKPLRRRH